MNLILYGHPFSSYTWKVLIALYEKDLPFEFRIVGGDQPEHNTEFAALSPLGKFPLLFDDGLVIEESSIIIEHIVLRHANDGDLMPLHDEDALDVRSFDRICDWYVMTPMQRIVGDFLRPSGTRDSFGVAEAKEMLDKAYRWLEDRLEPGKWANGWSFTLADCSAAPALFYADWVHPVPESCPTLKTYRAKLLAHPSVGRVVDEARPYRHYFPLGAPDRD
jgi:glutathione S-transferase